RVGVVHGAAVADERAHAGPLAEERRPVDADARGDRTADVAAARIRDRLLVLGREVVLAAVRPPLLRLGDTHAEVEVEIAAERRRTREAPAHALSVDVALRCE